MRKKLMIHKTALIDRRAKLGVDVQVGPYSVIAAGVIVGDRTRIGSHCSLEGDVDIARDNIIHTGVVIRGKTKISEQNEIYHHASIGEAPQDLKYKGEMSEITIGARNKIREGVTIHRGTQGGRMLTKIGHDNLLMAYTHVAHDCFVGDHVVMANGASLAGHVTVEDYVIIGGLTGVSQFCRVGQHAIIAGCSGVNKDVPPYSFCVGQYPFRIKGINSVGLQRRGFSVRQIQEIKRAFRVLFLSGTPVKEALHRFVQDPLTDEQKILIDFVQNSKRGLPARHTPDKLNDEKEIESVPPPPHMRGLHGRA